MTERRKVYLDACCFIDLVKQKVGNLPTERDEDVWFLKRILQANRDGEIDVFTSVISIAEATHAEGNTSTVAKNHFENLLMSGQYVRLVQPTPFIAVAARDLRWNHDLSLRGMDAIHVASALDRSCEEIISTDGRLRKDKIKAGLLGLGLKAIRSPDSAVLPIKYKQYDLQEAGHGAVDTKH